MIVITNIKSYLIILLLGLSILSSCSLDIPLEDEFADPDAITSVRTARELLASIYAGYPHLSFDLSLLSDDFQPTAIVDQDVDSHNIYRWYSKDIKKMAKDVWLEYYNTISLTNTLILRLPNVVVSSSSEQEEFDEIVREVSIIKAMAYFDLLRLFAPSYDASTAQDGILLKNTLDIEFLSRSTVAESCNEIMRLVNVVLDSTFISQKTIKKASNDEWLTTYAAQFVAMELSLYKKDYADVITRGEDLIAVLPFNTLSADECEALWSGDTSYEDIFSWSISNLYYTEIHDGDETGDFYCLNNNFRFVSSTDVRKEYTTIPITVKGNVVRGFGKYNRMNINDIEYDKIYEMRVADIYLMLAEAYANNGEISKAIILMTTFLEARNYSRDEMNLNEANIADRIKEERRIELIGEGERFFDLKRWGEDELVRKNQVGSTLITIPKGDYRWTWPIPSTEYKVNSNVTQNTGWFIEYQD